MSELIEMPYGNGKALALEFIKAYSDVQLDAEIDKEDLQNWKVKMTENKFKLEIPKPCPFCGKRELTFVKDSIIQCLTCGTVFIHPFSKDEKSKTIFEIWQIRSNEQ